MNVSTLDNIPEPWRTAMENVGMYTLRELSRSTGVAPSTVAALVYGRKSPSERTMQAVADSLQRPVTTIRGWAAKARGEVAPWLPPAEANRLNTRQRDALDELIRSIAAALDGSASAPAAKPSNVRDLARPPAPDLSRVAARRGHSEGKRRRREQDDSDA